MIHGARPKVCWGTDDGGLGEVSGPVNTDSVAKMRRWAEVGRQAMTERVSDGFVTSLSPLARPRRDRHGPESLIHLLCHLTC